MVSTESIIKKLEDFAPKELVADWDNSGWQVFLGNNDTKKILLTLSVTLDVVEQAIEQGCDLIISHHPAMFSKINTIDTDIYSQLPIVKAIQNNIQIYSAHSNLDRAQGGIADTLCQLLEINNPKEVDDFVKVGELEPELTLDDFVSKVKTVLSIDKLKLINPSNVLKVKKVALCPGSGGDFVSKIKDIDVYITGDIKYHTAIEVSDTAVIDAGHFETERIILKVLKDKLADPQLYILIAEEKLPWAII